MKKSLQQSLIVLLFAFITPQFIAAQLTTLASGGNKKASVGERIGLTDISIHYDRPGVKNETDKYGANSCPLATQTRALAVPKQHRGEQVPMKILPLNFQPT